MTNGPSFLPDDYVRDARERRSSIVALALFVVVMGSVFAAFLVTNRQWNDVRVAQANVNEATEKAAKEIEEMKSLEAMRAQMVEKAELARGLLEPVPRSVLLATLVNTMPGDLSLLEFDLKSEEIKAPKQETPARNDPRVRRAVAKQPEAPAKPEPVRRRVLLTATGVAPDDLDVSRWMSALSRVSYLEGIRLEVSEEKEIRGQRMRQFKISMRIDPGADVRGWDGLQALRTPEDPMNRGALDAGRIEETPAAEPAVNLAESAPALVDDPLDETLGGGFGGGSGASNGGDE